MTAVDTTAGGRPATCRRGHPLTAETVRFRRLVRNGRESLIRECRECVKVAKQLREARKAAAE